MLLLPKRYLFFIYMLYSLYYYRLVLSIYVAVVVLAALPSRDSVKICIVYSGHVFRRMRTAELGRKKRGKKRTRKGHFSNVFNAYSLLVHCLVAASSLLLVVNARK